MFQHHQNFKTSFQKLPESVKKTTFEYLETLIREPYHPLLQHRKLKGAFDAWNTISLPSSHLIIFQYLGGKIILQDIGLTARFFRH